MSEAADSLNWLIVRFVEQRRERRAHLRAHDLVESLDYRIDA